MDLSEMMVDLSDPESSSAAEEAAREFLERGDTSAVFERVYTWLVWQRTLRACITHLERAGADLDALLVSPERFAKTFHGWRSPWNLETDDPVSARRLLDIYTLHRELLTTQMIELLDSGEDGFALVSGRAYQARYPDYAARVEFDTDVVAPDLATGARVVSAFAGTDSELDTVRIRRLGSGPDAIIEIRARRHGHTVSLGVLVGGYHAHRGLIFERSTWCRIEGRRVRTASPEDLLVMLAARVERKRRFGLVNVNDATAIVRLEPDLDWAYVVETARRYMLAPTLLVILESAEWFRGSALPPGWRTDLADGDGRSRSVRLARTVADADLKFAGTNTRLQAIRRLWLADLAYRKQRRDSQTLGSRLRVRMEEKVLSQQLERNQAAAPVAVWEKAATLLRKHSGTLCEAAPEMGAASNCMSVRGEWRGSEPSTGLLAEAARAFAEVDGGHDCNRYRFALANKEGT